MSRVGIIGVGHGRFGRRSDATVQELAFEAYRMAMEDAKIEPDRIDASVIGAVPEYHKQRSCGGVIQEYLNLNPKPTWLTEVACASGSAALRTGWMAIKSSPRWPAPRAPPRCAPAGWPSRVVCTRSFWSSAPRR